MFNTVKHKGSGTWLGLFKDLSDITVLVLFSENITVNVAPGVPY